MTRISPTDTEGGLYQRIMAHRPEILEKWTELDNLMRFSGVLSPELKEEVRRALAPAAGCVFCSSLAKAREVHPDRRESLAVAYALMLCEDHHDVDDSTFAVLREEFTEPEIVELTMWALFMTAGQAYGHVVSLPPAEPEEIEAYAAWTEAGRAEAASHAATA